MHFDHFIDNIKDIIKNVFARVKFEIKILLTNKSLKKELFNKRGFQ